MPHHTLKDVVCKGARVLDAQGTNSILKDGVFVKFLDIIKSGIRTAEDNITNPLRLPRAEAQGLFRVWETENKRQKHLPL
jgi:hypothetical protein